MANRNSNKYNPATANTFGNIKGALIGLGIFGAIIFGVVSATEDYSNGERIGFITKFSYRGRFFKSWEGEMNITQTGMNTSSLFDFSIDNDKDPADVIAMIDSAVNNGWKVKLTYHQVYFKNWFSNRGDTDYFINKIEVLDKNGIGNNNMGTVPAPQGHVIDTVYVVIDKSELFKRK